ncbi:MAG: DEAD/DEAH box helicase family protein [Salinivirgaceae bacterium]|nr:DEAD/DEAH box helicase family protein [Salinivirgaceae bacterium]
MFYRLIKTKRDQWLSQSDCPVLNLIKYIEDNGKMRDAQIEAIKTYLFLKIACENKPLAEIFKKGLFNTLTNSDIDNLSMSTDARQIFKSNPAIVALYEFSSSKDDQGNVIAKQLATSLLENPQEIDIDTIIDKIFYGVSYPDYVFSLPMGAGKTYLMAAFIYLDLYFAQQEPNNKSFAHNFMVLVPSGLKTSVIPSLRTIQDFDPSWIIPEPAASKLKRELKFEMLDENKSEKKSNRTKNPNVQKIAVHEPLSELFGFVAVTNAEKVILDRIDKNVQNPTLYSKDELKKIEVANELRNKIGKIPNLSILIDEVHHVASSNDNDEAKLRSVVNKWTENNTITTVLGFSGTPYLDKKETINITDNQTFKTSEMSNIVDYYPLANGIGNFLKVPKIIKSDSNSRTEIVEKGVRKFFELYKDTVYGNGTYAKLGIYCGTIESLEEVIYPLVSRICTEMGLNYDEAILKFHDGNNKYAEPNNARSEFAALDKALSKKRIVLLVQIGKEGWDCKSLTGIILSQEKDCSQNMVLQTSCRCLREVYSAKEETALIYLNAQNYKYLEKQLQKQQHITIDEFQKKSKRGETVTLNRYDRTEYLHLPKMEFYQLHVNYSEETTAVATTETTNKEIALSVDTAKIQQPIDTEWKITSNGLECVNTQVDSSEHGAEPADFSQWLYRISKESFSNISMQDLLAQADALTKVFETITYKSEVGNQHFSSHYNVSEVNANIRKAFYDKRILKVTDELIGEKAELVHISNETAFSPIEIAKADEPKYYPEKQKVENIHKEDIGEILIDENTQIAIKALEAAGQTEMANSLRKQHTSDANKDISYHYLPYRVDSAFESKFLAEVLTLQCVKENKLEVYYNGDGQLTEFRIDCYKQNDNNQWGYIGKYTPDFLIIKRDDNNQIYKALIVETKGEIYAKDEKFKSRKDFVESEFLKANNDKFGYKRFDYLYLEDTLNENERITKTNEIITSFFNE